MAGFFGLFDFTKEGPGVDPDAPPKGPFATFFGIVGRKFWQLVRINLLYLVCSIPFLIAAFFGAGYIMQLLMPELNIDRLVQLMASYNPAQAGNIDELQATAAAFILIINFVLTGMIFGLTYFNFGPTLAGVTKLLRNYGREEHAFIWMDFKESFTQNWKLSLPASILSTLFLMLLSIALRFYNYYPMSQFLSVFLRAILWISFFFVTIMQMYLYPIFVTFDLSFRHALRNAALFTMLRLPFNLGIILLQLFILGGIPFLLYVLLPNFAPILIIAYYLFFAFGFNYLLTNFFVWRQLDRYMIKPLQAEEAEEVASVQDARESEEEEEEPEVEGDEDDDGRVPKRLPDPDGAMA